MSASTAHHARARPRPARPLRLAYRPLFSMPAPLRDPATAILAGNRFVLAGGLDAADISRDAIDVIDLHRVLRTVSLPNAQHDAQAATLDGTVYVFGGGGLSEYDHILGFDPRSGRVTAAGVLPRPASDVAVTAIGATAYIIGGFDGVNYLSTILAWHPGSTPSVAGHLPVGVRYAAVTAVDGSVLVIGGSTPAGASNAVYRFDPGSGNVHRIGRLPHPITHGGAATIGSFAYLVGGRGNTITSQTAAVWSIDPHTGAVRAAGHLPSPTSDAGVLSTRDAILVAGGLTPTTTLAAIGGLVPVGTA